MQNNPRKQDIIQELRGKRQDVTELCPEAEAVNEPHTGYPAQHRRKGAGTHRVCCCQKHTAFGAG